MRSLLLLAISMVLPWAACVAFRPTDVASASKPAAARNRAFGRFRRVSLGIGTLGVIACAITGARWADPVFTTRWPTAGSWFFASLCGVTAWASLVCGRRTSDEAAAMPALQMIGRTVQMAFVPALAAGLSLIAFEGVQRWLVAGPTTRALVSALLSVGAVSLSPWLAMTLGVWRPLPLRIQAGDVSWRLVHLPVPSPFFVHAAALPRLHVVLVSDGLFNHAPVEHWRALVRFEASGASSSGGDRAMRWALALPLCVSAFVVAFAVGGKDASALVAATLVAVCFTFLAAWLANRQPSSRLLLSPNGPSMRELAQSLRSLPPPCRQALPRTSHQPLGSALYDRLFALGHDPGPRPQA